MGSKHMARNSGPIICLSHAELALICPEYAAVWPGRRAEKASVRMSLNVFSSNFLQVAAGVLLSLVFKTDIKSTFECWLSEIILGYGPNHVGKQGKKDLSFTIGAESRCSCGFVNTAPEQDSQSAKMCKECAKGQVCCLAFNQMFTVGPFRYSWSLQC